jgi:hypothetical protein
MPGLVPGIHVLLLSKEDVDGRDEPGHDESEGASAICICNSPSTWRASARDHVGLVVEPEAAMLLQHTVGGL